MSNIRITIDYDKESLIGLSWRIVKGIYFCKKLPYKIRKSSKGYHIIWSNINVNEHTMFVLRKVIGDDPNRIRLDLISKKRIKQVLFTEKITTCYGYVHPYWTKKHKTLKYCPKCKKKVLKSEKVWSENKKGVFIYHVKNKKVCKLPLPTW